MRILSFLTTLVGLINLFGIDRMNCNPPSFLCQQNVHIENGCVEYADRYVYGIYDGYYMGSLHCFTRYVLPNPNSLIMCIRNKWINAQNCTRKHN